MAKYVNTTPIEAERFDGSKEMIDRYSITVSDVYELLTPDGNLVIIPGDWIATYDNGEYWPIADDIFKQRCKELPVIPEAVSKTLIYAKKKKRNLSWVFMQTPNDLMKLRVITQSERQKFSGFFRTSSSNDIFARAWLDGYQVEVEE